MAWQDKLAIFSAAIGFIGFVITIITLIFTGSIKKAVKKKENEFKTQILYDKKYESNKQTIDALFQKNESNFRYDDFRLFRTTLNELNYCETVFSDNDKKILQEASVFCNKIYKKQNNMSDLQKKECIDHVHNVKIILTKEDRK